MSPWKCLATLLQISLAVVHAAANPAPFTPAGGLGTNSTPPVYTPMSDFDFQSLNLALNQEWIELNLFHHGLARMARTRLAQFSVDEFESAGIGEADRFLIELIADQEVGHATVITNILGRKRLHCAHYVHSHGSTFQPLPSNRATTPIHTTVRGFVDFCQKIWFTPGITRPMAWTLLSPYITSCPAENPHIVFQNFPALNILNNPSAIPLVNSTSPDNSTLPAITHNRSIPLSNPGYQVDSTWELPEEITGYNNSYITNTSAGPAQFVAWISQLNTTYTPLFNINGTSGSTLHPNGTIFAFAFSYPRSAVTDNNTFVTPFNLSEINQHIVGGPAIYLAG
ncbi:hypothetical protein B0H12DRAFT_1204339 [Mycena haematopus]|nr:hypothetical protein B0H12DRAFT_1204339 [Mycena haematopus]